MEHPRRLRPGLGRLHGLVAADDRLVPAPRARLHGPQRSRDPRGRRDEWRRRTAGRTRHARRNFGFGVVMSPDRAPSSGLVRWGILGPGGIAARFMRHANEAANARVVA